MVEKERMEKARRNRFECATIVDSRGTSKKSVGRKILHRCLKSFGRRKLKEQDQQLKKSIFYQWLIYATMLASFVLTLNLLVLAPITSIDNRFGNVTNYEGIPDLETPTECEDKDVS